MATLGVALPPKEEKIAAPTTKMKYPSVMTPDHRIDITAESCPMTFVLVRLALDQMKAGEVLEVRLRGAAPRRNVPLTAREQGHEVLGMIDDANGDAILTLRRG